MINETAQDKRHTGLSAKPPHESTETKREEIIITAEDIKEAKDQVLAIFEKEVLPVLAQLDSTISAVSNPAAKERLETFSASLKKFYNKNDHSLASSELTLLRLKTLLNDLNFYTKTNPHLLDKLTNNTLNGKRELIDLESDMANVSVASFSDVFSSGFWKGHASRNKNHIS